MPGRSSLVAVVLVAALAAVSPAYAAHNERRAIALFHKGEAAYNKGRFKEALADFRAAYKADPEPGLLFNIAQCLRRLGRHAAAAAAIERYLDIDKDLPNRADVEALLAEERAAANPPPPPAAAPADAAPPAAVPTDAAPDAPPAEDPAAAQPDVTVAPAEAAAPAERAPAQDEGVSPIVWVAVGGTALAVAAGGAVAAFIALQPAPVPPSGSLGTIDFR